MKTNQATKQTKDDQTAQAAYGIDWEIVEGENTEFAVQYPRMQWAHGEAKASGWMKSGGLFISKDQYPSFTAEGFEPTVLITNDGTEIEGYAASRAKLAVIRVKHQWIKDEKFNNRNVPLAHALVVLKGCDDLLCLSLRGATKALEFQKSFNQHIAQNVSVANRSRPQGVNPLEPFALWFPLHAGQSRKAQAKDNDKASPVTPPELVSPETIDREYVTTLWVGSTNYKLFAGYYKETMAWQKLPIWEQRNGNADHELPDYSGGGESDNNYPKATDVQLQMLIKLATIKDLDEREIVGNLTHGETDRFENLTPKEASELIEALKAS
jgi:hypothetical protein